MKFEEILPALKEGKKVKQKDWKDVYLHINSSGLYELSGRNAGHTSLYFEITSLLENDNWEIVEEKKKVKLRDLTLDQFEEWQDENCLKYKCRKDCPFRILECDDAFWIDCKDMFSDKFLDQEIEIEMEGDKKEV